MFHPITNIFQLTNGIKWVVYYEFPSTQTPRIDCSSDTGPQSLLPSNCSKDRCNSVNLSGCMVASQHRGYPDIIPYGCFLE